MCPERQTAPLESMVSSPYDDHRRGEPAKVVESDIRPLSVGKTRSPTLAMALVMCAMRPNSARASRASHEGKLNHHDRNGVIELSCFVGSFPVDS